ncbi:unnamed protein product [Symbiodinium sp. CCMP2592]|nr:unnamed protein product [Symbiodinium sp. CCMP2592]
MQHPSWRRFLRHGGLIHHPFVNLCRFAVRPASTGFTDPAWWLKGQPRKVFGSRAEVELLSQLAVLLMPGEPITKAFRDFPVKKCKEWGSNSLRPDFTAHGVLRAHGAALFIEYDGHYRHLEPAGLAKDTRKTDALLRFAPTGSVVVRIVHKERQWKDRFVQVLVNSWQAGHAPSLRKTLQQVLDSLLLCCRDQLVPGLASRLEACAQIQLDKSARAFAVDAALVGKSDNSGPDVRQFLQKDIHLSTAQVAKAIDRYPRLLSFSIEANLKPTVEWIKALGLSQSQVAKVIATFPQVLGLGIEANLKPTVECIKGFGLSQSQVAKVILGRPQVLGYSIESNLKPTVEWIKGLGLSLSQVAKVIATFPQVLGLSIEANLKPTVECIKGFGLSQSQVAKVIAACPQVLGYSIEANLKPTVEWVRGLGLSQPQVAEMIAAFPQVLGYSIDSNLSSKYVLLQKFFTGEAAAQLLARAPRLWSYRYTRLEHRLHVLQSQGQLSKLAGAMTLGPDDFNRRFAISRGNWTLALALLQHMQEASTANEIAFSTAINACTKGAAWEPAVALLGEMDAKDIRRDNVAFNATITACEKGGRWESAVAVAEEMASAKLPKDVVTYSALITALEKGDQWADSLALLQRMKLERVHPNVISFSAAASAAARGSQWASALDLLEEMRTKAVEFGAVSYNTALAACGAASQWEEMLNLLKEMLHGAVEPDDFASSVLLAEAVFSGIANLRARFRVLVFRM